MTITEVDSMESGNNMGGARNIGAGGMGGGSGSGWGYSRLEPWADERRAWPVPSRMEPVCNPLREYL